MAITALVAVTAGGASAATDTRLCIDSPSGSRFCALDPTDIGATSQYGVVMAQGIGSEWVYPNTPANNSPTNSSNTNYIVEAATSSCLQVNADGGYVVRLAPCIGDEAESWTNYYNPTTHRTEFVSAINFGNASPLCLSFDASGTDVPGSKSGDILRADPCIPPGYASFTSYWYQQWGTS